MAYRYLKLLGFSVITKRAHSRTHLSVGPAKRLSKRASNRNSRRRRHLFRSISSRPSSTLAVFHRLRFETGAFEQTFGPKSLDLSPFVRAIGRPFAGKRVPMEAAAVLIARLPNGAHAITQFDLFGSEIAYPEPRHTSDAGRSPRIRSPPPSWADSA